MNVGGWNVLLDFGNYPASTPYRIRRMEFNDMADLLEVCDLKIIAVSTITVDSGSIDYTALLSAFLCS